ncbi:hypothetical protein [Micromonospora sp. NPDC005087]|uniref:hypothetical protein n=1 Tax=Micromonospora sp. NPDC005087 TaxID=3364225 RepID=UPI0036CEC480
MENPEAWLRRVAVNVARSRYRRRRVLDGLLRRIGPPPAVADHSPEHLALLAALRGLPEGQRSGSHPEQGRTCAGSPATRPAH